jgi:predicted Ser/Thr protein kinase
MMNKNNFIDIFKDNIIDKSNLLDMNDNKNGYQSKITFYKISDECNKKIFNQCSIELIDNIIIKKEFIDHKRYRHIQNNKQQFKNEIDALLLLNNCNHFPKLLSYDEEETCIYISYCGTPLSSENIPDDWKYQLNAIIVKLNINKNIYHNDMMCRMNRNNGGNFCVLNNILYLIDFGWASKNKPEFPNQNITLKNIYFNKEYKKMLKYEKEKK